MPQFFSVTSIAIKLDSPGPILIRQTLFGYGRRAVRVYRFRFATHCLETQSITPRLTRVGRIMHQTGIGELPQLFSVLFGQMSIVGPRPYVNEQDLSDFPQATLLNSIKPGIIDWAFPAEFRTSEQRVNDDLYYAKQWSPYFDIKIILTVLFAEKPIDQGTSLCGGKSRGCRKDSWRWKLKQLEDENSKLRQCANGWMLRCCPQHAPASSRSAVFRARVRAGSLPLPRAESA